MCSEYLESYIINLPPTAVSFRQIRFELFDSASQRIGSMTMETPHADK